MTAIRKLDLQYACFQHLTSKTTEIGYSDDRFGLKWDELNNYQITPISGNHIVERNHINLGT